MNTEEQTDDPEVTTTPPAIETPAVEVIPEPEVVEPTYAAIARNLRGQARRLREMSGMTTTKIAKAAGCSTSTVTKATDPESGEDIKLGTIVSVIHACGGNLELRLKRGGEYLDTSWNDINIL